MAYLEMPRMLRLSDGSAVDPAMIHVAYGVPGKGVVLKNEYNKLLEYLKYSLPEHQKIIVDNINLVQSQGEDWLQPDWGVLLAKAPKQAAKTVV